MGTKAKTTAARTSKNSFTVTALTGDRVLVEGTDTRGKVGSEVLVASYWADHKAQLADKKLHEEFNAKVEAFYQPLTDAADELKAAHETAVKVDTSAYVVVQEGVEGVAPQAEAIVRLERGDQIVRLIESGDTDRLVWVGETLEILALS